MRHYTTSHLLLLPIALLLNGFFALDARDFNLYNDCEEYYDSRGFYHNKCKGEELDKKELMKSFNQLYDFMEPGSGPKALVDANKTQPLDDLLGLNKKKDKKRGSSNSLYEDDNEEDELSQPESEIKQDKSNNQSLKERPKLEFGREN